MKPVYTIQVNVGEDNPAALSFVAALEKSLNDDGFKAYEVTGWRTADPDTIAIRIQTFRVDDAPDGQPQACVIAIITSHKKGSVIFKVLGEFDGITTVNDAKQDGADAAHAIDGTDTK